uniref:Protein WVD2-like 7 isoform X1 n=1 Tax=Elaeis guineensis var. tenera TaxID=51953 RepID=A0A6I9RSX0_ELAGV|nr:protein WVD2-like 7 isoform X1 [Elaeis guineensis]XP_010927850.1 protein WVD2-like 7 isoform X1 [Elaeis guineensis]XP_029121860.1 protein WVD2-like 7 isoform X1 [Elaeis guineensis]
MAADVGQAYYGWSQEELSDQDDSQEASVSQMLDHGSISFGRFAAESLSWEKRSVFTHDRRQEELEKFSGLVAKKKAYFEEYYRRLRALKALQQNQQTELTLDYGGDGSNSSQTGEDDETALQHGSLRDGAAETMDVPSGEPEKALTFKQDTKCSETLQTRQWYRGSTTSNIDSLGRSMGKIELEKNSNIALIQDLDRESLSSLSRSMEEIEQNDISSVDDKEILREQESPGSNIEPEPAPNGSVSDLTNTRPGDLQLALDHNLIPDKTKLAVEKPPDCKSVPEVKKEPVASIRTGPDLKHGTRTEVVKLSRGDKHSQQKLIGKADSSLHSGKATANEVASNNKSASVALHGSVTEVCSNITNARPFSLAMERRSGNRESAVRLDSKTPSSFASSRNQANCGSSVQGGSKSMNTTCSAKSRGLKIKSDRKEVIRKTLTSESEGARLKGRAAQVVRQSKSSSINLLARNKSNSDAGPQVQLTNTLQRNKSKEEKEDRRLKRPQGPSTKIVAPFTGNLVTGNKKAFPAQTGEQSNNGRKLQVNNMLQDGRKPTYATILHSLKSEAYIAAYVVVLVFSLKQYHLGCDTGEKHHGGDDLSEDASLMCSD